MKLSELLQGIEVLSQDMSGDPDIREVCYDSRQVQTGDLFVAISGFETDGHRFIQNALDAGAVAVVCEKPQENAPYVQVDDARAALAAIAANRFGHPARKMKLIGVTGTNGKTTVTYLIKHMLEMQGFTVGLIGTNQNMIGSEVLDTERTTPESYELHHLFAQMQEKGCTYVVMEVSSHSLALERVHGLCFEVAAFTNLTQDHLDFHQTMEEYRKAKAKLFGVSKAGVINLDDPSAERMLEDATCPCMTFSSSRESADLTAKNIVLRADGVQFLVSTMDALARVKLGIPGAFSVQNALAAIGTAVTLGISLEDAAASLSTAQGVKGRVEVVPTDTDYTVLIDYAHSPDGVQNVLQAVRGFAEGRVIALFGCGGDRDKTKRPKMGAIAAQLADVCVVTSDNPRTEDPDEIIRDILVGMQDSKTPMQVIADRTEAIHWALAHAREKDIIVLMGKGHETYQEVNHVKHHMDEREIVAAYFAQHTK